MSESEQKMSEKMEKELAPMDWSHVKETIMMLNLSVARLEHAMSDGEDSVETLADSFTSLAASISTMGTAASDLPESNIKETILRNWHAVSDKVHSSIIAFQFYDKLTQRLVHISKSLAEMTSLVENDDRINDPYEWKGLQEMIKSKYTLDSDLAMFDAILSGKSVEEILTEARESYKDDNDIELF